MTRLSKISCIFRHKKIKFLMFKLETILIFAAIVVSGTAFASTVEHIDRGRSGHIIVTAALMSSAGQMRNLRFLLDTGSNITVLDKDLVKEFSSDKKSSADIVGIDGNAIPTKEIQLNRIIIGGRQYDKLLAIELDLFTAFSKYEDLRVDGVIGMDILKFRSFKVDFVGDIIEWEPSFGSDFVSSPLRWTKDNLPQVMISMSGHDVWVTCDLGYFGFISLLSADIAKFDVKTVEANASPTSGISGVLALQKSFVLEGKMQLRKGFWENPEISVSRNNDYGNMGLRAFWPKAIFDFKKGKLGLVCDEIGKLSFEAPRRVSLALAWEKNHGGQTLVVMAIKPGGIFDIAGLRKGDRILQLDEASGSRLTIKSILEIEKNHDQHKILIERDGGTLQIDVN